MILPTLYHPDGRVFVLPAAEWWRVEPTAPPGFMGWGGEMVRYRWPCTRIDLGTKFHPRPRGHHPTSEVLGSFSIDDPPLGVIYRAAFLSLDQDGEPFESSIAPAARLERAAQQPDSIWYVYRFLMLPDRCALSRSPG